MTFQIYAFALMYLQQRYKKVYTNQKSLMCENKNKTAVRLLLLYMLREIHAYRSCCPAREMTAIANRTHYVHRFASAALAGRHTVCYCYVIAAHAAPFT